MKKKSLLAILGIVGLLATACEAPKPAEPAPQAQATSAPVFTIREVMKHMVAPKADVLWNAVAVSVTDKGIQTSAPKNDEEWGKLRDDAVTIVEAMNSVMMPGRKVAKPGEPAKDPTAELPPDQIEVLINKDRENWTKFARALQDSVLVAVKAIDAKDTDGLSNAGGGIDTACENCHKQYWYPNDKKNGAPAADDSKAEKK